MSATILDGKALARKIREGLAKEIGELTAAGHGSPGLAVVLVGEDEASQVYVRNKERASSKMGMNSRVIRMPADASEEEVIAEVKNLNADPEVHGFLVQLPLPDHISEQNVLDAIDPVKDADGLHQVNMGKLILGRSDLVAQPCTPLGMMTILDEYGIDLKGKESVIVGRSNIVGKPIGMMLMSRHSTITYCHSRTTDLPGVCRRADVLVAAIGRANMIKGDWIKPGAALLDVGINRTENGLVGDIDFEEAKEVAGYITPVPGGVGPMTIAMLMRNTVEMFKKTKGI
jgi:methylenetetrahydrofolate dehydrogenase (NADP+) / methenyltetrahydrofolate cyclohydrolase